MGKQLRCATQFLFLDRVSPQDEVHNQGKGPNLPEWHENGAANDITNRNMEQNRIAKLYMYCIFISDWKLTYPSCWVVGCFSSY